MARKGGDQAINSSLALLQERFTQLQKTREMRQERELMRLISDAHERHAASSSSSSSSYYSSYVNTINSCNSAPMHYHHYHHQPQPSSAGDYDSEITIYHHQKRPSSSSSSSQLALSLWPDSAAQMMMMKRPNHNYGDVMEAAAAQDASASATSKSWLFGATLGPHTPSSAMFDDPAAAASPSDVDTSLRL